MKEVKNKKTGRMEMLSDEAYAKMLRDAPARFMTRFTVTDVRSRPIVPSLSPKNIVTKNINIKNNET